jgi:hypothetical protein
VVRRRDARRVARELADLIEHHAVLGGERRVLVVLDQRTNERLVQRHGTQKLCVGVQSIVAAVAVARRVHALALGVVGRVLPPS